VLGNEIALNFTKNEILDMYVNRIFYGNFAVGVGSAAELYFLKPASQLDLAQAAMLAGLPQSPTAYNPLIHSAHDAINPLAKSRQKAVLQAMGREWLHHAGAGPCRLQREAQRPLVDRVQPQRRPRLHRLPPDLPERELPAVRQPGGYEIHTPSTRQSRTSRKAQSPTWSAKSASRRTWATVRW